MWNGEYNFVLQNLILKDFRIRYRNMSLGVFWSLLNPLVMMGVLTFVFTLSPAPAGAEFSAVPALRPGAVQLLHHRLDLGTTSVVDNASLIKRVPFPREIMPMASVLSNTLHLLIQIALLLSLALWYGKGINIHWLWLPVVWVLRSDSGVRDGADLLQPQRVHARHPLPGGVRLHGPVLPGADLLLVPCRARRSSPSSITTIRWRRWCSRCGTFCWRASRRRFR